MSPKLTRLILLWLALMALAGCRPPAEANRPSAPDFSLYALDGQVMTLSEQRGQWLLLNFWATWCAPCVAEMPYLQTLAERDDLIVWGINMRESTGEVADFSAQHGLTFPLLLSPDDALLAAYPASGLPHTYLIAPDGTIVQHLLGPLDPATFGVWLEEMIG